MQAKVQDWPGYRQLSIVLLVLETIFLAECLQSERLQNSWNSSVTDGLFSIWFWLEEEKHIVFPSEAPKK